MLFVLGGQYCCSVASHCALSRHSQKHEPPEGMDGLPKPKWNTMHRSIEGLVGSVQELLAQLQHFGSILGGAQLPDQDLETNFSNKLERNALYYSQRLYIKGYCVIWVRRQAELLRCIISPRGRRRLSSSLRYNLSSKASVSLLNAARVYM